ncbi:hypothetical protein JOM56_001793 [Amanita muscaria]
MKLNSLYIVAFGAALASVEAAPVRLLTTSNEEVARGLRFGHAVGLRDAPQVEARTVSMNTPNRPPCFMRKMAMEAIKISNSFRKAVGLPLIESPIVMEKHLPVNRFGKEPTYSILPFIGTPPTFVEVKDNGRGGSVVYKGGEPIRVFGPDGVEVKGWTSHAGPPPDHPNHPGHPDHHPHPPHHPQHGHHGHHPHHGHKHHPLRFCRQSPFLRRLTFALMSLGKWEGRAVAFVLGCGLGVLLRMLWVLSVISYRTFNGNREVQYTVIHEYVDASETPVAPPTYTYVDEKAVAKEETPAVAPATPAA